MRWWARLIAGPRGHHEPPIVSGSPPTRPPPKPTSPRCPSCPHGRDQHNAFGCCAQFCGCERTWIGGGWP